MHLMSTILRQCGILLRRYGAPAFLGVLLLAQVVGPRLVRALSLPTQNFSQLQDIGSVADQLRNTPVEAQDITKGLVDQQLAAKGISGKVDVAAVVERNDLSSIASIEGITPSEKIALANNTRTLYVQTATLVDRAKLLSSRSATIAQPGDGEGGGFTNGAISALTNSSQDVLSDLDQYSGVIEKTQSQLEKIEKLWKLLGVVLQLKPVFLPEKPDYDTNVVCINYVAGSTLYPQLISNSFGSFTELNGNYSSVLGDVTTSIQRRSNVTNRLTDATSLPISVSEIALQEKGDYAKLVEAGRGAIGQSTASVAGAVTARYGSGFESVSTLTQVSDQMRKGGNIGEVAGDLSGAATDLRSDLVAKNATMLVDLQEGKPGSLETVKQALGPDGAALADRYASLESAKGRASDPEALDGAQAQMRTQIAQRLDTQARSYSGAAGQAAQLAESYKGKDPSQLIAEAGQARTRVEERTNANLDNSTSLVTRLTDRKNYGETMSSYLDQWNGQEGDFQYLSTLSQLLNYQEMIKLPTF